MRNIKREAWYLIKYLSKEDSEGHYLSGRWVFPGWMGFSQWFKREFGDYPPREMLVDLGKMSRAERNEHVWFGVYLWKKRKQNLEV